ncbi:RdgB/HAM1 family non-canonical purine NTP pyrophosphatase [Chitinasiproducens palmae]|uniref:dITP/XTP pyrophosphatase n=1 Tax=Chitinasiproducens palmae TaxID=1770053 RepID=A0A1H2PV40_9BURK|nr:RdgB/HAM1 family non-canonical purine NTP pyrophosphatase [Chitinasiproducens palmae]SDV51129.1 XTP/dITP diphosphohydrolase [Chitinasiproducens palmae]
MSATRRLVLASNNAGKLREFGALLRPTGFDVVAQGALGVSEADEPFGTFVENALAKARHAAQATGLAALADDSGLVVPALGGAPGVYSARYAALVGGEKSDAANNARLLAELAALGAAGDRRGFYYCVLVLIRSADDPCPLIAEGIWPGTVLDAPRGDNGFGYDPYFLLPDSGLTAAELAPEEKNRISHRGQALASLLARLSAHAA